MIEQTSFEEFIRTHGEELLRLAFTYVKNKQTAEDIVQDGETEIQLTPLSKELKPISEPLTLSDGGVATIYQRDEIIYFIIEKDGKYHYIPYFDYYVNEDPQYVIYELPLQEDSTTGNIGLVEARNNSTYEKRMFFYYSETNDNYQYYESTNTIADLRIDLDEDGQFEIIFDDGIGSIVKIEDGLMKATNIANNIREPEWIREWIRGYISVELIGPIATVTYLDANGSKSGFYDFKSTNEIILYD
ncbi:RNA polymerase sigma factor [Ureibacillus sp. MALMAid1270]|uniref:RNA polymerase sigma factor n=1 Tax=Ureibacillus sp. MALMAid1270 TaxID=3411629 RepID=UPI003BA64898